MRLQFKVIKNPSATEILPHESMDIIVNPPIFGPDPDGQSTILPTFESVPQRLKLMPLQATVLKPLVLNMSLSEEVSKEMSGQPLGMTRVGGNQS